MEKRGRKHGEKQKKELNSTGVKAAGLYTTVCHTEGIYL